MKNLLIVAATLIMPLAAAANCEVTRTIRHNFDAGAFDAVSIMALAGRLDVVGTSTERIIFNGRACTDRDRWLDDITLEIDDGDRELRLLVSIPYGRTDYEPRYAYMDIEVELPRSLAVTLRDSSGDILVRGANVIAIDDSSGDIRVEDSEVSLDIRDSSGDIDLRQIKSGVVIRDSSGSITLRDIAGDIEIPSDSAGDIEISDAGGSVAIARDSSGNIEIENVASTVEIGSDGSGDIEIRGVEGNVTIGSDGSGSVRVNGVRGDFTLLSKGSGDIRIRDVDGRVSTPR